MPKTLPKLTLSPRLGSTHKMTNAQSIAEMDNIFVAGSGMDP